MENRQDGYDELLANIRRLTVMVLDNLEAGSRDRTLDQAQKRLLSSTGARLLRLWRVVLREGGSQKIAEDPRGIEGLLSTAGAVIHEGTSESLVICLTGWKRRHVMTWSDNSARTWLDAAGS